MVNIYARLTNQNIFKYQTVVSTRFDKQDEDDQVFRHSQKLIIILLDLN